jgi:hypothetical protein
MSRGINMANQDEALKRLKILAVRAKKAQTTYSEDIKLGRAISEKLITNRSDVKKVLTEALTKSANEIDVVLASDNGDRLADEIVSLLED